MLLQSPRFYLKVLLRNMLSAKGGSAILSAFGALWLLVEWARFVFPTTVVYGDTTLPEALRHGWWIFLVIGLAFAVTQCKPRLLVCYKVKGRDVSIEIVVGDIFSFPGAMIVGCNTTFDTQIPTVISPRSIQGMFTKRYYEGNAQLQAEISASLTGATHETVSGQRVGNLNRYPIGTCVTVRPKERIGYLLAIADINEHGTASGTFEDLKVSLAKLWEYIATRGEKEALLIPVLGTGFGRLPQAREEVVHEIVKSFLAASSERTFTDKLTIVLASNDVLKYGISVEELGSFLRYQCNYAIFSGANSPAMGTATD